VAVLKNAQTNEQHVYRVPSPPLLVPSETIQGTIGRRAGVLSLRYRLSGRLENLLIPATATAPERTLERVEHSVQNVAESGQDHADKIKCINAQASRP